jgi:hypothetical protein
MACTGLVASVMSNPSGLGTALIGDTAFFTKESLVKAAQDEHQAEVQSLLQSGLWYFFLRGASYTGCETQALPTLRLQISGSRMFGMVSASELMKASGLSSLAALVKSLQSLSPDAELVHSLSSFTFGQQNAHEMLFIPAGYLYCEKAVHSNCNGMKCMLPVFNSMTMESMQALNALVPQPGLFAAAAVVTKWQETSHLRASLGLHASCLQDGSMAIIDASKACLPLQTPPNEPTAKQATS